MRRRFACEICGAPATRTVHDHEHLPDETFWQVDATSPPWHLCDDHAGSLNEYRDRLKANLARAEGLLTSLDSPADDLKDSETITMAGELRRTYARNARQYRGQIAATHLRARPDFLPEVDGLHFAAYAPVGRSLDPAEWVQFPPGG